MEKQTKLINLIMFLIGAYTIYLQIFPPQNTKNQTSALILFLGILGYIGIVYVITNIIGKIKSYLDRIEKNEKDIQEINKKIDAEKRYNEIDKRVSIMERLMNKKGQINAQWIFIIILLILLYLYLRSLGIVN